MNIDLRHRDIELDASAVCDNYRRFCEIIFRIGTVLCVLGAISAVVLLAVALQFNQPSSESRDILMVILLVLLMVSAPVSLILLTVSTIYDQRLDRLVAKSSNAQVLADSVVQDSDVS